MSDVTLQDAWEVERRERFERALMATRGATHDLPTPTERAHAVAAIAEADRENAAAVKRAEDVEAREARLRAGMGLLHRPSSVDPARCAEDEQPWPCDTARLLATADADAQDEEARE